MSHSHHDEDDMDIGRLNHSCLTEPEAIAYHRQGFLHPEIAESIIGCSKCEALCEKVKKESAQPENPEQ